MDSTREAASSAGATTLDSRSELWLCPDNSARAAINAVMAARSGNSAYFADGRAELNCSAGAWVSGLHVVIELEFVRVRAEPDGVDVGPLQLNPGLDQVGGEDVTLEQVLIIGLQVVQYAAEAVWHGLD